MFRCPALVALLFGLSPLVALADTPGPMILAYADFEAAVPHVDLADCPAALAAEAVFCRATLAGDAVHVFVFSEADDLPLVGFASFGADALAAALD